MKIVKICSWENACYLLILNLGWISQHNIHIGPFYTMKVNSNGCCGAAKRIKKNHESGSYSSWVQFLKLICACTKFETRQTWRYHCSSMFFWGEIGSTCSHLRSLYGNTNLLCVPLYSDIYTFKAFVLNGFPQTAASYDTIKTPPSYDFTRSSAFYVNFFQQGNSSLWLACIQYHMSPSSNSTIVAVFLVAALVSLQRTAEVYPSAWFAPPLAACFRCFPNS